MSQGATPLENDSHTKHHARTHTCVPTPTLKHTKQQKIVPTCPNAPP